MTNNIEAAIKNFDIRHNVSFRVIDQITGQIVQEVQGHNAATNSMLQGIAHYLVGDGVVNQAAYTLARFIPRYISLGTMGLFNQDCDEDGLPLGIGEDNGSVDRTRLDAAEAELEAAKKNLTDKSKCYKGVEVNGVWICQCYRDDAGHIIEDDHGDVVFNCDVCKDAERQQTIIDAIRRLQAAEAEYDAAKADYDERFGKAEAERFTAYMNGAPGFGADGYDDKSNNGRKDFGLGPKYSGKPIGCELINDKFPRVPISFRQIIPEAQAELPETIDIVFSAMISTGALAQFRDKNPETNKDRGYIFITEAGLWSKKEFVTGGDNGLLAGYRLGPPNETQWDMYVPANRKALQRSILRVGYNQVVQVIWKVQLGALGQFIDIDPVKRLYLTNVVVQPSGWTSYTSPDAELAEYHWMYSIDFEGVNADMLPTVIFNPAQVRDDNYADVCDSGDKCVIIYAKTKPETAFTIPTIYAEGTR